MDRVSTMPGVHVTQLIRQPTDATVLRVSMESTVNVSRSACYSLQLYQNHDFMGANYTFIFGKRGKNRTADIFRVWNSHGQRSHVTMAISDAEFSTVWFCSYTARRIRSTIGLLSDSYAFCNISFTSEF